MATPLVKNTEKDKPTYSKNSSCAGIKKLMKEKGSSPVPETMKIISENMKVAVKMETQSHSVLPKLKKNAGQIGKHVEHIISVLKSSQ